MRSCKLGWHVFVWHGSSQCCQSWAMRRCVWATHQLLDDPLHQGGEGDAVALSVVINIFDQLRDHLCVRLWLKLISFGDLRKAWVTVYLHYYKHTQRSVILQSLIAQISSFTLVASHQVFMVGDNKLGCELSPSCVKKGLIKCWTTRRAVKISKL